MSEMHAGDALWYLHAGITYTEEQQLPKAVTEYLRECARIVGAHIGVPEPFDADVKPLLQTLRSLGTPDTTDTSEKTSARSGGNKWGDPERVENAKTMLDAMVSSDLFEWADMVDDIHSKMHGGNPFITDKMFRALVNIARKGEYEDETRFWDAFEDEYPEAARFAAACADSA